MMKHGKNSFQFSVVSFQKKSGNEKMSFLFYTEN